MRLLGWAPDPAIRVLLAAVVLLAFPLSGVRALELYQYFDDFSTNKAQVDSYGNSGISDPPCPELSLYGYMCYLPDLVGDRSLAFFCGFEIECAYLRYRFPLDAVGLDLQSAMLQFEVPETTDPWGSLEVYRSFDGTAWTQLDTVTTPGSYQYQFPVPPPYRWVYIEFTGGHIMIDDLGVTLNYSTATAPSTWGLIKALFR